MALHCDARPSRSPAPRRRPRSAAALLGLAAALAGCPGEGDPAESPEGAETTSDAEEPTELRALTADELGRVQQACGRCHAAPDPAALPRSRWDEVIPTMLGVPVPAGTEPLTREEAGLALLHYRREAPAELAFTRAPAEPAGLELDVERFTPRGLEERRIPATANVSFVRLSHERRYDVIAAEMRSRSLFLLAPWAPAQHRRLGPLKREVNYPVHTELADVNGDGRLDVLVASIGGMNPGNHEEGSVTLLLQDDEKQFDVHVLLEQLGRVADVSAGDLDGDGDLDLVASAFGWRGPGQLLVLENRTPAGGAPRFEARAVDDRDGFIHVEPTDLDGDGRLDVVALLSQEHEQVVAFMNRGGLELEPVVLHAAPHPAWGYSGLQLVDLDRDGDQDVLVSNGDALDDDLLKPYHGVSWLENRGGEGVPAFRHRRIGRLAGCERAVAGDLDGDGDLDVTAVAFLPQLEPARWEEEDLASIVWFERTGGPEPDAWRWTRRTIEEHRCTHPTVDVADYDQDGDLDIVVGSYTWLEPGGAPRYRADYVTLLTQR